MGLTSLDNYRVFYQIAIEHNASRAAEKLFITQSAVSQSLRHLEEDLGSRLFDRLPRGMELTAEGKRLFTYVEGALGLVEAAEREMQQISSLDTGELYIAAADTLCKYHLLPFLAQFHEQYPGIALRITNRTSTATAELVRHGRVDLGMINMPCDMPGIDVAPVSVVHDCFVSRSPPERSFAWREIVEFPLLLLEQDTITRRFLDETFLSQNLTLNPEFELGSIDLLVEFAKTGIGVSQVPREYIANELNAGELFELKLDPPFPERTIGIARRSDTQLTPAAAKLFQYIVDGPQFPK